MTPIDIKQVKVDDCLMIYDRIQNVACMCKVKTTAVFPCGGVQNWVAHVKQYINCKLYERTVEPKRLSIQEDPQDELIIGSSNDLGCHDTIKFSDVYLLDYSEMLEYVFVYEI